LPTIGFKEITFLGISKPANINQANYDRVVNLVQKCSQYQKVNRLNKTFEIGQLNRDSTLKRLKGDVAAHQDARYVHGVLVIEQLSNETKQTQDSIKIVGLREGVDHQWFQSFGYTARPLSSLFGSDEIAPKVSFITKNIPIRKFEKTLVWRFVLYNKTKDALIIDRRVKMSVALDSYSSKPKITDKVIEAALGKEMMEHIAGFVCPKIAQADRTLLANSSDHKADQLVDNGIDLAGDNRWEAAANQWKKAVLIDKRNAWAYHNLGIYYEKYGNIPAAMEEFSKAKKSGISEYQPKLYDQAINIYRPKITLPTNDMRVYGVGNAHWLLLHGGEQTNFKIGQEYPVYRIQRIGEGPEYNFYGIRLVEVGKVQLVKQEAPFILARITQFLEPYGIQAGDSLGTNLD
jgi:tetratricopeptide (TPR) repeat protein